MPSLTSPALSTPRVEEKPETNGTGAVSEQEIALTQVPAKPGFFDAATNATHAFDDENCRIIDQDDVPDDIANLDKMIEEARNKNAKKKGSLARKPTRRYKNKARV